MEIKRGYVVWTDDNGFHKEPLADHPDMLAKATPKQKLSAEEAQRLNDEGERRLKEMADDQEGDVEHTLEVLKKAPPEVLTADMLATDDNGEPVPELEKSDEDLPETK